MAWAPSHCNRRPCASRQKRERRRPCDLRRSPRALCSSSNHRSPIQPRDATASCPAPASSVWARAAYSGCPGSARLCRAGDDSTDCSAGSVHGLCRWAGLRVAPNPCVPQRCCPAEPRSPRALPSCIAADAVGRIIRLGRRWGSRLPPTHTLSAVPTDRF